MGRKRSTRRNSEDTVVEKPKAKPKSKAPPPPANAYWHVCVRCGALLSGPHTSQAGIRDAMIMPNICKDGCKDGET